MEPVKHEATVGLDLPEHGRVELPLAGPGGRALATLVDFGIYGGAGFLSALAVAATLGIDATARSIRGGVTLAVLGLVPVLGPMAFELAWRGQSPGKRLVGLRVISADGRPADGYQLLLRNALRLVDFLPVGYLAGLLSMFFSHRGQRLGDVAAGTLVVREGARAFADQSGFRGARAVSADLYGIPEPLLRGARLLLDPAREIDPSVMHRRMMDLIEHIRTHRPDLASESDDRIWARVRRAVDP